MSDGTYTLGDLARLADVTPRTVRYYVAQGLLPSPEAAGASTRYGEAHLARLRLIRRLQRDHLPLAEIRLRLERLREDEIVATVSALDARGAEPEATDTLDFVRSLMASTGVRPSTTYPSASHGVRLARLAVSDSLAPPVAASMPPAPAPAAGPSAAATPPSTETSTSSPADRSTWERRVITPDVEIHVRRPLDRATNRRVDQLERIARELFEEP